MDLCEPLSTYYTPAVIESDNNQMKKLQMKKLVGTVLFTFEIGRAHV